MGGDQMYKSLEEHYLKTREENVSKTISTISKHFLTFATIITIINEIVISRSTESNLATKIIFCFLCQIPLGLVTLITLHFIKVTTYTSLWKTTVLSITITNIIFIIVSLILQDYTLTFILLGSSMAIPLWLLLYLKTSADERRILNMCRLIDSEKLNTENHKKAKD